MKKRLLSLFLCVMMLLTLVPVTALAQDVVGADDQAAAQEAVQESVEDAAEDAVPAEPVKPTEAEGPVVLTREEAALDEPAEEDIATQDETGTDQATIVSIACAEETDADGYVHVMEGTDVYMEQEKGEWMSNIDVSAVKRLEFTVKYIPAGSTEQKTETGEAWEIQNVTGMEVSYTGGHTYNEDSGMYTPWKSGDTYEVKVMLGGESVTIKLKVDENLVKSVTTDSNEAIELVKGENGGFGTTTDPDTGEEVQKWYYSLSGKADATFTVTLRDGTVLSGTEREINQQIGASGEYRAYDIWFNYSAWDTSVWKPGQEYTVWYGMNGVGVERTVTISDAPSFESITPKFIDSIELLEGVDGYHSGDGTFRYDWTFADSNPTFTVTLTEDGARRYGVKTYEGDYSQIRNRFSGVYTETTNGKTMDEWPASDTPYEVEVNLGAVSCMVKVKVVENFAKSIQAEVDSENPLEVIYGTDAHYWVDGNGVAQCEYFYVPTADIQYSLTNNGVKTVYTFEELKELFEEEPVVINPDEQMKDGRWEIGSTHDVQLYFHGVTFDVPVKVVAPAHMLEKLEYVGSEMIFASGLHNMGSEWFWPSNFYDDYKLRVTYDGGKEQVMTTYEVYQLFGKWPNNDSNQSQIKWQPGQENCKFYIYLFDKLVEVPVTLVENPVVSLEAAEAITLTDNDLGYWDETYGYILDNGERQFKLTLTETGAEIYNGGKTEFTGTLDEICRVLNCRNYINRITSDQSADNVWTATDGKEHAFTVILGGEFTIPVTILSAASFFESLELADENYVVKLKEGADAASCLNGKFMYDAINDDELKLTLTLTDAGMKYFKQTEKVFTGTVSEIFWAFQYGVKQIEDNVQWNEDGVTGTATLGIGNGMFGDPDANGPTCTVNVKLEKSEVASVKCINAPVTLYEGVDDDGEFLDGSYYRGYTMTQVLYSERAQFEVTLTNGETFTGGSDVICSKLGFRPMADPAALYAQKEQPWSPNDGIEHAFTVYVGTASCEVKVKLDTATDIEINEENFPDEAFRNYLLDTYMYDGTTIKAEGVISLDCSNRGIKDLTGIELFPNLESLWCGENQLTELTISLPNLRTLNCYGNKITALDVSGCPKLDSLICSQNLLEALDVSQNFELTELYCYDNKLTALDISNNSVLKDLACYTNRLTTLDVSGNLKLSYLACGDNPLGTLDVSKNTELLDLYCEKSGLSTLDISKNTKLMYLGCDRNSLTALDLSNNLDLVYLYCEENQLTELDVSKHMKLQYLNCAGNKLTVLYLPGTGVETSVFSRIAAFFSPATYADEAAGPALASLDCSRNKLTNLDASKCEKLEALYCAGNESDALVVNVAELEGLTLSTVGATGTVEIRQDNTPVSGNSVSKEFDVNGAILTLSQGNTVKYKTVSYKGEYCFNAVADGSYTLTVTAEDYVTRSTTVTVTDGVITGMENFKIAVRGDMNLDGTIDVYDLQLLYECVSQITEVKDEYVMAVADVNGGDGVDIIDVQLLYTILTGSGGVNSAKTG